MVEILLTGRNLLLWKWPVTTLEVAAVTAVAEIPVHVAQKRIKALSLFPCCTSVHVRGTRECLGPITEFVVIAQGHLGTS